MSLVVTSLLVAGGVLLGRWIARGSKPTEDPKTPEGEAAAPKTGGAAVTLADPFEGFPCRLGDVLLRTGGDEAWLAGALVFSEGETVSALFVAPEAGKDIAIYVRPRPAQDLHWLSPIDAPTLAVMAEPPTSLEHLGTRFERQRRVPLRAQRLGTGAPDVGGEVIVAEYTSGTERMIVVAGSGTSRGWRGTSLEEGMYEVIPSGKSTLEE